MPEQKEVCPEMPEEAPKPLDSVNQDLPLLDALLHNVINVLDIFDDEEAPENTEEIGESKLDSLIAAYVAVEDVMVIHEFPTLSGNTRETRFTEARSRLVDKSSDFTPEDLAVAARVVDAHGSWESAEKLCPPLQSQDEGEEAQKGILEAAETAIVKKRTLQWAGEVKKLKDKCDGFHKLVKDKWNEYGQKVMVFEQAHQQTWYSNFNGSEGNATPAFSYGQSTFDVLTKNIGITPRALLTALSHKLPHRIAKCLNKEEICRPQQHPDLQNDHVLSEADMHELQLASHKLLLDYKKVCQKSAMSMLFDAAFESLGTGDCDKQLWLRPMLCGDHHLWNTQEIEDAASDIASKVGDKIDQADDVVQKILFVEGGVGSVLKAALDNADIYGKVYDGVKQMIKNRFGDKVDLIMSWYNWFAGWLAYGNWLWTAIGKAWRGAQAVSTMGLSEATPSASKILEYFVDISPWALKKATVYYKETHQSPNCKKLAADESELPDV